LLGVSENGLLRDVDFSSTGVVVVVVVVGGGGVEEVVVWCVVVDGRNGAVNGFISKSCGINSE
jgi:hypothetical protein